jgi:predicted PhzF superfamily epimerase YddE/YHI9
MEMRKRDRLNNDGEQAGRTGITHVRKEDRGRTVAIWMRGCGVTCKRSL